MLVISTYFKTVRWWKQGLWYSKALETFSDKKWINAKWILGQYNHLQNSPDSITKGLKTAGMKDALTMESPLEDLFVGLDGLLHEF